MAAMSNRWEQTVRAFIHDFFQEQPHLIVPQLVHYLILRYFQLIENLVLCYDSYSASWCYTDGRYPSNPSDWTTKTDFSEDQLIAFRNPAGQWVQAEVVRVFRDKETNETTKIFLSAFPSAAPHAPYQWEFVPSPRIRAPHCLDPPHWNGVTGTLQFGRMDEGFAEYRWTFKVISWRNFSVGIRRTAMIIDPGYRRLGSLCHHRIEIYSHSGASPNGQKVVVVVDVKRCTFRVEADMDIFKFDPVTDRSLQAAQLGERFTADGTYILVVDQGQFGIEQPFTLQASQEHIQLVDFSVRNR